MSETRVVRRLTLGAPNKLWTEFEERAADRGMTVEEMHRRALWTFLRCEEAVADGRDVLLVDRTGSRPQVRLVLAPEDAPDEVQDGLTG